MRKYLAAVACAGALALAGAVPASASTPTGHRDAAPGSQTFTIDFSDTTLSGVPGLGSAFVGDGPVTDATGATVGTARDHCDVESVNPASDTVECNTVVTFQDGSELHITADAPIPLSPFAYPYTFEGIVDGGTGQYDGASGDAQITAESPGVYQVQLQLR
jgi:hypothetical protein